MLVRGADLITADMMTTKVSSDMLLYLRSRLEDRDYSMSKGELPRYALRYTGDNT